MRLQGVEKRDQRLFVFRRHLQSEWVTQDRTGAAMVTFWCVILLESRGVEPFLQCVGISTVTEAIAKPYTT